MKTIKNWKSFLESVEIDPMDGTSKYNNFDGDAELEYINSKNTLIQKAGIVTTRTPGIKFPSTSIRHMNTENINRTMYSFQYEKDVDQFENYLNDEGLEYDKLKSKSDNWDTDFIVFGDYTNENERELHNKGKKYKKVAGGKSWFE